MGATLGALEARGLVKRQSDPADGRRAVMSVTEAGLSALSDKRNARTAQLARALAAGFTPAETGPADGGRAADRAPGREHLRAERGARGGAIRGA